MLKTSTTKGVPNFPRDQNVSQCSLKYVRETFQYFTVALIWKKWPFKTPTLILFRLAWKK